MPGLDVTLNGNYTSVEVRYMQQAMAVYGEKVSPPTADKRWKMVTATMRRHGYERDALIETLHTVQQLFGYLDDDSLRFVARSLRQPLSRVYGVATFYHYFTLRPPGEHTCTICLGTACYIKGAPRLVASAERTAGVKVGETSPDGTVSLLSVRCVGSCSLAPVALYDGELAARVQPSDLERHIADWTNHDT